MMRAAFAAWLLAVSLCAFAFPSARAAPPPLPDSFSVEFEVTDLLSESTVSVTESHDFDGNRLRVDRVSEDGREVEIFDYGAGVAYHFHEDGECETEGVEERHLEHLSAAFLEDSDELEQVPGTKEARGIECEVWSGRVVNETEMSNYTHEWWFSAPGWTFRDSPEETRVPVRNSFKGVYRNSTLDVHYEWVNFVPGTPPDDVFDPQAVDLGGAVCAAPLQLQPGSVPDDYYVVEEILDTVNKYGYTFRSWYSYSTNRMRFQKDVGDDTVRAGEAFVMLLLGDEDVMYVQKDGNCTRTSPIPAWAAQYGFNGTSRHLTHPPGVEGGPGMDTQRVYVGTATVRGMQTDRWRARVNGTSEDGDVEADYTEDVYFTVPDWMMGRAPANSSGVPVHTVSSGYYTYRGSPPLYFERSTTLVDGATGVIPSSVFAVDAQCPGAVASDTFPLSGARIADEPDLKDKRLSTGEGVGFAILFLLLGVALGYIAARLCCASGYRSVNLEGGGGSSAPVELMAAGGQE